MRDWADVGLLLVCTLACGRGVPSPSSSVGSVGGRSDSFTLTIDIAGQGTVTAAAQSLRCASTCAEQLAAGTAVYLDAQPAQGMQFMDWSGACTGAADCSLSLAADVEVTARFDRAKSDPCAGLTPSLPAANTFTIAKEDGGGAYCGSATSDGLGNLYFEGSFFTIKSSTGAVVGAEILFAPLDSGFAAFEKSMSPDTQYSAYSPEGRELSHVAFNGYANGVGRQANGGTVLVDADCNWTNVVRVRRFDDTNAIASDVSLADQQCFPFASATISVIVDARDRTLLLVAGPRFSGVSIDHAGARWFDAAGHPLTEWFDAGSFGTLLPLIGGGAAVRSGGAWVASIESGKAELSKLPAGFVAKKDAVVVLRGRAYAMVPSGAAGTIDIVEPGGGTCVSLLTVSAADRFSIGKDGTLINLAGVNGGNNDCTATFYRRALE